MSLPQNQRFGRANTVAPIRALCRVGHRRARGRRVHAVQYFDWDRFEAEQGDEEAAEQGGAAGGEQAGEE